MIQRGMRQSHGEVATMSHASKKSWEVGLVNTEVTGELGKNTVQKVVVASGVKVEIQEVRALGGSESVISCMNLTWTMRNWLIF
jgi:hypothetical protein